MKKNLIPYFLFFSIFVFSQETEKDSLWIQKEEKKIIANIETTNLEKPFILNKHSPKKAGFYSAFLPGLGQYYNKKYWKIPIALGGIGSGVGITMWNNKQYKRYKTAFDAELNGLPHEFSGIKGVTVEILGRTQDKMKRQRDYAIAITAAVYFLNILDAVVDAHLLDGRKDPDLAISPTVILDPTDFNNSSKLGLSLNFRF